MNQALPVGLLLGRIGEVKGPIHTDDPYSNPKNVENRISLVLSEYRAPRKNYRVKSVESPHKKERT
jgi:hypothetical protein